MLGGIPNLTKTVITLVWILYYGYFDFMVFYGVYRKKHI